MAVTTLNIRRGVAASAATLALVLGGAGVAGAATSGSSTTSSAKAAAKASAAKAARAKTARATATDPATLTHGPGETLVTGSDLAKATAAATAAVPGATIIRVESDSGGSAYEAHLKKADGTTVTLKFDASFNVTSTEGGLGGGPGGARP
ncbi:MAG: hypothetical protein QOK36_3266 [Gaiellales bacterium]|nr:hypothetical protein [Gaiellales bacterium]